MLYVLLAEHSADICPLANAKTREAVRNSSPEIPHLAQRNGVKILAGPFVSNEHLSTVVVEAEKGESLHRFIMESGLAQWNKVRVVPSQTMEEGLKEVERMKPIF